MIGHEEILTFEEIIRLAEISVELGVSKIRLTGGEPLVRKGVLGLIRQLSSIDGINNISMTTNGFLLERMAGDLYKSGLNRLNISLDTVNRDQFKNLTGVDGLPNVLKGIDAAGKAGFERIKLNAVILKGMSDDGILHLADYAVKEGLLLRFIEQMPFTDALKAEYMPASHILKILESRFGRAKPFDSDQPLAGRGPASIYCFGKENLIAGFITPVSNHFCQRCNRLRITADGKLKLCLLSNDEIDLKHKLRNESSNADIKKLLLSAINLKPEKHRLDKDLLCSDRGMSKIGG